MRTFFTIAFLCTAALCFSQKVKIKEGKVLVDKAEFLKIKEDKVAKKCYTLSNLNGEELFYLRFNSYLDPKEISQHNQDGSVAYFEVLSADLELIYFETRPTSCLMGCHIAENVVSQLFNGEAINADGTVNQKKIDLLAKKIGFEYSKKRNELEGSGTNTIIIKDDVPRTGININLGR